VCVCVCVCVVCVCVCLYCVCVWVGVGVCVCVCASCCLASCCALHSPRTWTLSPVTQGMPIQSCRAHACLDTQYWPRGRERDRERKRARESERERERGSTRNSWPLRATDREASRESVSGARQTRICLPWEPALGVYVALAGSLRGLVCATWRVCTTSITVAETGPCARAFTGACVQ